MAEKELKLVLDGQPVDMDAAVTHLDDDDGFQVIVKQTVCYIVCVILFNDNDELLMIQEAKSSCRGMWYLPAGRVDPDEDLVEAAKRETVEESGLHCDLSTLLCVEVGIDTWYRFTMTGHVTGGSLKSVDQSDKESIQAKWCSVELIKSGRKHFPLRSSDIVPLIDYAVVCRSSPECISRLPSIYPHKKILLRCVLVNTNDRDTKVLVSNVHGRHLPISVISMNDMSFQTSITKILKRAFGTNDIPANILGMLSVEHSGKPCSAHDGICFTVLLQLGTGASSPLKGSDFEWLSVTEPELVNALQDKLKPKRTIRILFPR